MLLQAAKPVTTSIFTQKFSSLVFFRHFLPPIT